MASFPRFAQLPVEIQNQIWAETARLPRTIHIHMEAIFHGLAPMNYAYSPNPVPSIMHVSSEARNEYTRLMDENTYRPNTWGAIRVLNSSLVFARNDVLHIQYKSPSAGRLFASAAISHLLRDRNLPFQMVRKISITSVRPTATINDSNRHSFAFQGTQLLKDMVFCLLIFPCLVEITADFPHNQVIGTSGRCTFLGDDTAIWALVTFLKVAWTSGSRALFNEVQGFPEPQFEDILAMRDTKQYVCTEFDDWGPGAARITLYLPRNVD